MHTSTFMEVLGWNNFLHYKVSIQSSEIYIQVKAHNLTPFFMTFPANFSKYSRASIKDVVHSIARYFYDTAEFYPHHNN